MGGSFQTDVAKVKDAFHEVLDFCSSIEYPVELIVITLFLPGICAAFTLLFGRFLNSKGTLLLNLITTSIVLLNSLYCGFLGPRGSVSFLSKKVLIEEDSCRPWAYSFYHWEVTYDVISVVMCILVTLVAAFVHFYSYNYLLKDPHLVRFLGYLNLFMFFMLLLVCSDNLIQFFFA
jgi:NADH:ubiquinone oxidoreductase subunit 5 (subunit L)/multisubunit Na+/H+ antiporter MnhA subunit